MNDLGFVLYDRFENEFSQTLVECGVEFKDALRLAQIGKSLLLGRKRSISAMQRLYFQEFSVKYYIQSLKALHSKFYRINQVILNRILSYLPTNIPLIPEYIQILKMVKWNPIRLAFDEWKEESEVKEAIHLIRKHITTNYRKIIVYCLINHNETFDEDLERIQKVIDLGATPYAMLYQSFEDKKTIHSQEYINLARWTNRPWLWRTTSFSEYKQHFRKNKVIGLTDPAGCPLP